MPSLWRSGTADESWACSSCLRRVFYVGDGTVRGAVQYACYRFARVMGCSVCVEAVSELWSGRLRLLIVRQG